MLKFILLTVPILVLVPLVLAASFNVNTIVHYMVQWWLTW